MPMLLALLVVTFAVTAVLVREAWLTARAQRELAGRAAQDYAAYATWSTARIAETNLYAALSTLFRDAGTMSMPKDAPLPTLATLLRSARWVKECRCVPTIPVDYYFRIDFADDSVSGSDASGRGHPVAGWVPTAISERAKKTMTFTVLFEQSADSTHVVAFVMRRDAHGHPRGALGFVTDPVRYANAIFPTILGKRDILPRTLTRGIPNDSLLVAAVIDPYGGEIFRSAAWRTGTPTDTASLPAAYGGMLLHVALRPEAAARLHVSALPRSRVALWSGLLAVSGVLVLLVMRTLRREHELARLRSEFTASVSHELRTPLAQILLFGETLTLGRTRSESERLSAAEVIVREARRLMHLVENALHFSRSERQAIRLSPEPAALAPLVRDILHGFAPLARDAAVELETDLDASAEALVDRSAFRQMVLNLLDNAVKYGGRRGRVRVELAREAKVVRVAIEDRGPGVRVEDRERVWQPFVRGETDAAESGGETGSGIALAVVRDLALRHRGRTWVESGIAGGARFIIELPATGPEDAEEVCDAVATVAGAGDDGRGDRT